MSEYINPAPRDAEADIIEALARFGIEAATSVPAERGDGLIRVSRAGGDLTNQGQRDRPLILVEVWGASSVRAWDLAIPVWAAFRVIEHQQKLHPSGSFHGLDLQVPRALDDDLAPDLFRVQFTAQATVALTEITLEGP